MVSGCVSWLLVAAGLQAPQPPVQAVPGDVEQHDLEQFLEETALKHQGLFLSAVKPRPTFEAPTHRRFFCRGRATIGTR